MCPEVWPFLARERDIEHSQMTHATAREKLKQNNNYAVLHSPSSSTVCRYALASSISLSDSARSHVIT